MRKLKNKNKPKIENIIIPMGVGGIVGYGVYIHNFKLVFLSILVGVLFLIFIRKTTHTIIEDERTRRVEEKALSAVVKIFAIGSALVGTFLITYKKYSCVGYTLNFSVCLLLILYLLFYMYYNKKPLE